ncbi:RNA helicase [Sergentomyia squamirostris]
MADEWDDTDNSCGRTFNQKPSNYAQYDNRESSNSYGNGGSSGGRTQREGDWNCPSCNKSNFASRRECFSCREPRADGGGSFGGGGRTPREGDWNCSSCNKSNFASRRECFSCKEPKADGGDGYNGGGGGGFGGGGRTPRDGDWNCPSCSKSNFASRRECFSCREPKPEGEGGFKSGGAMNGGGGRAPRAGDWTCSDCKKSNFASRNECFSCHKEKDDNDVVATGGENGYNGSRGGDDAKPRAGQRPGDWTCPSCEKANFASRTECFGCSEPKPAHLISETDAKPVEFYIPPEVSTDENELFGAKINTGINFNNFSKIPVKVTGENVPKPIEDFSSSGLREFLLSNVSKSGYNIPTPIQKYSIPAIMNGRDLMGCAQTGSGKTAAFLLPIINALLQDNRDMSVGQPHVLIVTPTRELCIQIYEQACKFAHGSYIKVSRVYGGTATRHQGDSLKGGTHILVATPGRLMDFVNRSYITFSDIRFVVLDEADRMLDMGFSTEIEKLMKDMPQERQTLMYSATFPEDIQHLAGKYLKDYVFITVGIIGGACTDVKQQILEIPGRQKRDNLMSILGKIEGGPKGVLVFLETKKGADFLASFLSETDYRTTSIHSDRMQKEREMALSDFKTGRMCVMIATSVAARGLDIPNVKHVINYDMPKSIDEYVHRIGRTGRVGNQGEATTFFDPEKDYDIGPKLVKILKQAGQDVPEFLEQYDMGGQGRSGGGDFGGRDVRKDNFRQQAVTSLEAEEEW